MCSCEGGRECFDGMEMSGRSCVCVKQLRLRGVGFVVGGGGWGGGGEKKKKKRGGGGGK